jgi:hypothetical protein
MSKDDKSLDAPATEAAATASAKAADDDVKRRYREALDRKQAGQSGGGGHAEGDSKVHEAHGPAKAQRTFRRKAGG